MHVAYAYVYAHVCCVVCVHICVHVNKGQNSMLWVFFHYFLLLRQCLNLSQNLEFTTSAILAAH